MLKKKPLFLKIIIIIVSIFLFLNISMQIILSVSNSGLTLIDIYAQRPPKKDQWAFRRFY